MTTDLRDDLQATLGSAYTLERELGGGGMSRVFLAVETALGRRVVVKVLPPETSGAVSAERFRREVQLAARLQHPHIVPLLGAGESGRLLYYTMPFVDGETLRARLTRDGALPIPAAVGVIRDVAKALAYAHRHGVMHRDVKPENVLLGEDGVAVVADFGIAKALAAASADGPAGGLGTLTTAGMSVGTPAYMAPEQALGDPLTDARADLYALGVIAYEMLAGSAPFVGRTAQALIAAHATEPPELLTRRRATVPAPLAALVMRLLEKHPADRPQSADEVLQLLDAVATPSGTSFGVPGHDAQPPARLARRAGGRGVLLAGAAALLLAAAGGAAWYYRSRAAEPAAARTVAVVPFENLGNAADLYFADGVTEEIASRLARVPGLTVLGRASAIGLRGSGKSPQEIGRALGAAYVLRGSVRWARAEGAATAGAGGTTVRIVPALVNVASGADVWGESYQAPLTDVFRVQAEVADRVAVALESALGAGPTGAARGAPAAEPVAPAAFDAYLLGRFYWRKRGVDNLRRAVAEYRRAVALDSGFARAWAGYADTYSVLPGYGDTTLTAAAARREAEPAARRAIALDPADAQGYIALASVLQNDYDFRGALAALDQALARDPSDATAHQRRAEVLQALGRVPEAEAAGRRALALDPLSAVINHILAGILNTARRDEEAIRLWRRAVELEPAVPLYKTRLATTYAERGRLDEADAVAREAGDTSRVTREIRRGLADPRYRDEARAALAELRVQQPDRANRYGILARMYARLDMPDSAFAMLSRGAAARHPGVSSSLEDQVYDGLRDDPRWAEIVRAVRGR